MSSATKVERKYALMRLEAGDYLLPDNDGIRLWRIASHVEDDGRTYWGAWLYSGGHLHRALADHRLLDWDRWDGWVAMENTRQEAIEDVLR